MSLRSNNVEDEIDLKELIAVLWFHKVFIFVITSIVIILGNFHVLTTSNKYTATAIFQIKQANDNGLNLTGELSALATIAGISNSQNSPSEILLERIKAGEFILNVSKKFQLANDPFFNTYNPNYEDPLWKATLKKILGWKSADTKIESIIENNIISNYREFVTSESTLGGAFSISVTHENPIAASKYANAFMEEIRYLVEFESNELQELRLDYLSQILADSLQDMEIAQKNLKEYALQNSAVAQENFLTVSLQLDQLRMEQRKVEEIADVLLVINKLVNSKNFDETSYAQLQATYPLVDDVDFRRILGMSETISAWIWPDIETIASVSATLKDRVKRLDVEIKNIEDNAKIYAASAKGLAKFTRDAKVAEATYKVLIEQVKSQSLAAGFEQDTFKVFEYATPPLAPSSPRRKFILALSAALGILLGVGLAFVNSIRQGIYYTKEAILSDSQANLFLKTKSFRKLSRSPFRKIGSLISKHRFLEVDEVQIKLASKKLIYVVNFGSRAAEARIAQTLAKHSAISGRKVLLCDKTVQIDTETADKPKEEISGLSIVQLENNLALLTADTGAQFFTSSDFHTSMAKLVKAYDQVFLFSNKNEAKLGLLALKDFNPSLVLLSRLRNTRKVDIKKIAETHPIDILLYD